MTLLTSKQVVARLMKALNITEDEANRWLLRAAQSGELRGVDTETGERIPPEDWGPKVN